MSAPSIVAGLGVRLLLSVVVVALLLLLATPLGDVLVSTGSGLSRLPEIRDLLQTAVMHTGTLADEVDTRHAKLRTQPAQATRARITAIDRELSALAAKPRLASTSYLDMARLLAEGQLGAALDADVRRRVLAQERQALQELVTYLDRVAGEREMEARVTVLEEQWRAAKQREIAAEAEVRRLQADRWCKVPWSDCSRALEHAFRAWRAANAEAWRTYRDWEAARDLLQRLRSQASRAPAPVFRMDRAGLTAPLEDLQDRVSRMAVWQITALQPVLGALKAAVVIVAVAGMTGVALKGFFFWVLARLAERRPPMVVRAGAPWSAPVSPARSVLSMPVTLSPHDELLVVGDHLQSIGRDATTRTQFLLSWRHPFASLVSGLWMMIRVRTETSCTAVLSATRDPLEELNAVTLGAGDALVVLPKHLVGLIQPVGRPGRLRSRWVFGLHALLTLQFRHLVMDGPCTLVVAGCRGVRIESAQDGRRVSQAMTVGFSANLAYSVARSETFTAYLLGQRPLFNDRFQGPGIVLHQELPSTAQRRGVTGRGLQGMLDGAMKAFGL